MMANKMEARSLTSIGELMLAKIKESGNQGVTRGELAAALGKTVLNRWHIAQLDLLQQRFLITVDPRPRERSNLTEFIYRAAK